MNNLSTSKNQSVVSKKYAGLRNVSSIKKDANESIKSNILQDESERVVTTKSIFNPVGESTLEEKVKKRQTYYQQQEQLFQQKKKDIDAKSKSISLKEAYNSMNDFFDNQQILQNIRNLKHSDRKKFLDKVSIRKDQIKQVEEQALYYKHRNILEFYKNRFLQTIHKKKKLIDDDMNHSKVDNANQIKIEQQQKNMYQRYKNVARLFQWTNGVQAIKEQKGL